MKDKDFERSPLMDIVERAIIRLTSRRDIIRNLILDHDLTQIDANKLYKQTVEMITDDEYCLTEEEERAIRMASLRRDHAMAESSGDLKEKIRIKREFAETRDILSPKKIEVSVHDLDQRTHGQVLADILSSLDLEDDEDVFEDEEIQRTVED